MTFRRYFCNFRLMLKNVLQNKHIMILHTILLFLTTTLPAIVIYSGMHERYADNTFDYMRYRYADIFEILSFSSPCQMLVTAAVGIITSFCCYSYLNSSKSLIFHNSMPYKRSNVYLTRFISGLVQMAIPVIILFAVNSAMYFGYNVSSYADVSYGEFAINTLVCIFMYALTFSVGAFTANISSNIFAQGISLLFVFLAYLLTIGIVAGNFEAWFETYTLNFDFDPRYIFPPCVIYRSELTTGVLIYDICYFLVFTALGCVAAVKRATESTNKFFAFKFINTFLKYYIALFASLGFGLVFASISNNNIFLSLLGYILFGFLAFSILQAIFEKNIRAMFANLKGFTVFAVILVAVMFIPTSGVLDLDNRLPASPSQVKVDSIGFISELTFKDPENIKAALKLAEVGKDKTLEIKRENNSSAFDTTYVSMSFGNSLVSRRFRYTPTSAVQEFVASVYDSDECKEHLKSIIKTGTVSYIEKNNLASSSNFTKDMLTQSREELKKLLIEEMDTASYEDIMNSYVYAYVSFHLPVGDGKGIRQHDIPVYSCYEKSIALIADTFLPAPSLSELTVRNNSTSEEITVTDKDALKYIFDRTSHRYHSYIMSESNTFEIRHLSSYVGSAIFTDEEFEMLKNK